MFHMLPQNSEDVDTLHFFKLVSSERLKNLFFNRRIEKGLIGTSSSDKISMFSKSRSAGEYQWVQNN